MKCLTDSEIDDLVRDARSVRDDMELRIAAYHLISEAARLGLVLTIEQVPRKPLAMGHYDSVVSVRPALGA